MEGLPGEEILRAAKNHEVDLITIATHGHTGWRHLVFGSVAERVLRAATIPVMTVSVKGLASLKERAEAEELEAQPHP